MRKSKKEATLAQGPNVIQTTPGIIRSHEELEFGLRGIVRILGGRGKSGKNGYFFEGFKVVFASEIGESIEHEETFLDYENLKIIVKLPDPIDPSIRDVVRHQLTKDYTMGADDLKTRAALIAFEGLDEDAKKALIAKEKALEKSRQTCREQQ